MPPATGPPWVLLPSQVTRWTPRPCSPATRDRTRRPKTSKTSSVTRQVPAPAGKPTDNARNEAFNGLVRRECLSQHYFLDLNEAAAVLESWKEEYNKVRPHGSLGQLTSAYYEAGWSKTNDPERLERCV